MLLMFQSTSSFILQRFDILLRTHPAVVYFLTMLVVKLPLSLSMRLVAVLMFQSTSSFILQRFDILLRTHPAVVYFLSRLLATSPLSLSS